MKPFVFRFAIQIKMIMHACILFIFAIITIQNWKRHEEVQREKDITADNNLPCCHRNLRPIALRMARTSQHMTDQTTINYINIDRK